MSFHVINIGFGIECPECKQVYYIQKEPVYPEKDGFTLKYETLEICPFCTKPFKIEINKRYKEYSEIGLTGY